MALAAVCAPAWAQTAATAVEPTPADTVQQAKTIIAEINDGDNITVEMDDSMLDCILNPQVEESKKPHREAPQPKGKIVGYRVQIFADNNARNAKSEARMRERAVARSFPYSTYVTYASPYWRLRVGDFATREEAAKVADSIRKAFPKYAKEVRVVKDNVYIR
ncbi:MAG: SPOR domain-containing protein [Muribaculaceae bacterium]|nr:SPOR domain-containing protein [Muribaculaceae bacterium]